MSHSSRLQTRTAASGCVLLTLLLLSCTVQYSASAAYFSQMSVVNTPSVVRPSVYCLTQNSGFPPNLYSSAQQYRMIVFASRGEILRTSYVATSGTSKYSAATLNDCFWVWVGGPLAAPNYVKFYQGGLPGLSQDPTMYSEWSTGFPLMSKAASTLVGYAASQDAWMNTAYAEYNTNFVCEYVVATDPNAGNSNTNTEGLKSSSTTLHVAPWISLLLILSVMFSWIC